MANNQNNHKEDANLEAYRSLTALYIQVDESLMTRHKFFLTIVIALFTALGFLIYQVNNCNYYKTSFLINITLWLGGVICFAWLLISTRGLFIDKIISKELIDIEAEIKDIHHAFSHYTEGLIGKEKYEKLKNERDIEPSCFEKPRMEYISIFLTVSCLLFFFVIFRFVYFGDIRTALELNKECVSNLKTETSTCSSTKQASLVDKEKITDSPINNNITINIPSDKDKNTKTMPSNSLSDDCIPNS